MNVPCTDTPKLKSMLSDLREHPSTVPLPYRLQ